MHIKLAAVHWTFHDLQLHLAAGQFHHRRAGDPFQDVLAGGGRDQFPPAHQEDIAGRPLRDMSALGEKDRFVKPVPAASSLASTL